MPTLTGRHECTLDAKNRIFAPARFREQLAAENGRHFMVAIGLDRCLYLFLPSQWEQYVAEAKTRRFTSPQKKRAVLRLLFSNAVDPAPDEQGRILISQKLRDYAGLSRDVLVIGAGTRAELWDRATFEASEPSSMKEFRKISAGLDL